MATVPKEDYESEKLANRLDNYWYRFSAIRNESDTKSFYKWKKRKKMWVRPWIPDFCIILKRWSMCFVELKRQRPLLKSWKLWTSPSKVSLEQIEWKKKLRATPNVFAEICFGVEEAILFIITCEAR